MENVILGVVLSLLIIVPLAIKWELRLKPVIFVGAVAGLFSGLAVYVFSLFFNMGFAVRLLLAMVLIILIASSILLARFYRDPERTSPQTENCIVSPADGIIKYVKLIETNAVPLSSKGDEYVELTPGLLGILPDGKGYLVGIGMSFMDVHVTRAPINGKITFSENVAGSFFSLKRLDAVYKNERLNQVIENDRCGVGLIHIASRLVRRIVPYVGRGDRLVLGQRIGRIKFGSQVDVILPDPGNLEIKTGVGEKVIAGETIIALLMEGN